MAFWTQLIVLMTVLTGTFLSTPALAYSGNFQITDLSAESPFQADPTSTSDSFVSCKSIPPVSRGLAVGNIVSNITLPNAPKFLYYHIEIRAHHLYSVDVFDQDTPDIDPLHCGVSWAAGSTPPSTPSPRYCANDSYSLSFPTGTYGGVANFTIVLQHRYIDNR